MGVKVSPKDILSAVLISSKGHSKGVLRFLAIKGPSTATHAVADDD